MNRRPTDPGTPPVIELHIEELVLHGFSALDRARIGEAVQRELTRLLTEHGLPQSLTQESTLERLDGGTFRGGAADLNPEATGIQVARSVWGGLGP